MTKDEAASIAERVRIDYNIPEEATLASQEEKFIEVTEHRSDDQGPVRDARVWIIKYSHLISWTELAIDQKSGKILRVIYSR